MQKKVFCLLIFLGSFLGLSAQISNQSSQGEPITVREGFWGLRFKQGENRLSSSKVLDIMRETNDEAYRLLNKAFLHNGISWGAAVLGGGMVGYGLAVRDDDPNGIAFLGIGLGLVIGAYILDSSYNKKTRRAVDIYNAGLQTSSFFQREPQIDLVSTSTGFGIIWRF